MFNSKLVVAALLTTTLSVASAATMAGEHGLDPAKVQARMQEAVQRLQLTPEQQATLKPIVEEHVAQLKALRDKHPRDGSRDAKRAMMQEARTLRDAYDTKVRGVLTDEQEKEWDAMRREARDRMRDEWKQRRETTGAAPSGGR
jgi:predicted Zn-dependent protease